MKEINSFSISPTTEDSSQLSFNGQSLSLFVSGVVLEAQYCLNNGCFLLFVTDDCPFEEGLHILLLDSEFDLIDQIDVSQIYTPGLVRNIKIISAQEIEFDFIGEQKFQITVLEKNKLELFRNIRYSFIHQQGLFKKKHMLIDLLDR